MLVSTAPLPLIESSPIPDFHKCLNLPSLSAAKSWTTQISTTTSRRISFAPDPVKQQCTDPRSSRSTLDARDPLFKHPRLALQNFREHIEVSKLLIRALHELRKTGPWSRRDFERLEAEKRVLNSLVRIREEGSAEDMLRECERVGEIRGWRNCD